jgi:hypothetical protein
MGGSGPAFIASYRAMALQQFDNHQPGVDVER